MLNGIHRYEHADEKFRCVILSTYWKISAIGECQWLRKEHSTFGIRRSAIAAARRGELADNDFGANKIIVKFNRAAIGFRIVYCNRSIIDANWSAIRVMPFVCEEARQTPRAHR